LALGVGVAAPGKTTERIPRKTPGLSKRRRIVWHPME
jgi:hypothetical protein